MQSGLQSAGGGSRTVREKALNGKVECRRGLTGKVECMWGLKGQVECRRGLTHRGRWRSWSIAVVFDNLLKLFENTRVSSTDVPEGKMGRDVGALHEHMPREHWSHGLR